MEVLEQRTLLHLKPVESETSILNLKKVRKAILRLRSLNHNIRSRLIGLLHDNGPMPVTDIYIALRLEQSLASQHLAILRVSGAVRCEREGKHIYYRINEEHIRESMQLASQLAEGYREYQD